MAIKVKLGNSSSVTGPNTSVSVDNRLKFPRIVYQRLGSLANNKTLLEDYNNGTLPEDLVDILEKLNVYHNEKYYISTTTTDDSIKLLDEYLGSLGNTETYPYEKDSVNIGEWIDIEAQPTYRVLHDSGDILVDGDEILIVPN